MSDPLYRSMLIGLMFTIGWAGALFVPKDVKVGNVTLHPRNLIAIFIVVTSICYAILKYVELTVGAPYR